MNKALAEILACWIPDKMKRNRWRGILRYGIFRARRLRQQVKASHEKPKTYLAICAIAKNEGQYFKEWIDWHLSHGVEKFYIYDNESTDQTREVLTPYIRDGVVEYKYWAGYRRQLAAYDDCLENHRYEARWIAFIDLDEFIVPVQDSSIPAFLKRFEDFCAVEINWLVYGSGGQKEKTPAPVMQRFRFHSVSCNRLNRNVKSIVAPLRVYTMIGCHEAARMSGCSADSHGGVLTRNFKEREPQHDVIRINHYAVKSYQEFAEKQVRGRASGKKRTIDEAYFLKYDLNDIEEAFASFVANTSSVRKGQEVVVSMTSFPAAIAYAERTIRSLVQGSVLPDRLVLYLTFSQFAEAGIPDSLLELQKSNPVFEIRNYGQDIRSYRKLIPALADFPEAILVTVDDDVHYHRDMLRELLDLHNKVPNAVLAHRAKHIRMGKPYRKWKKYRWYHFLFKRIRVSFATLATGVGGVLYPPHSLHPEMLDPALFTAIAPTTDDIWFWAAAVRNGVPIIPVPFGRNKPRGLGKPRCLELKRTNFKGGEDKNVAALKKIIERYPDIRGKLNDKG